MEHQTFYQRNLPHIQPPEGTFFITYRLFGSVPIPVIQSLRDNYDYEIELLEQNTFQSSEEKYEQLPFELKKQLQTVFKKKKYDLGKMYFKRFDDYLDTNLNEPYWLKNNAIAKLNMDALHYYNNKHYKLWAATIMPNHIHILITLLPEAPELWKVMKCLKSYTGKKGNAILDRVGEGKFWEEESYDHWLRKKEFDRILWYILNNPVKAKMVKNWKDWLWTYCHPDLVSRSSRFGS